MTLLLDEVEKAIQMAFDSHSEEVMNYLEHVNSLMIPPPRGSTLFGSEKDNEAQAVAKGLYTARLLMGKIKGQTDARENGWLMMFLAGYVYERQDLSTFAALSPVSTDFAETGCLDLDPAICVKIRDCLISKLPDLTTHGLSSQELGPTASWVAGRRVGRFVKDGEEAAAIFALATEEEPNG